MYEWGTVLLEVDGEHGKHVLQLRENLIVPDINVYLFSFLRVNDGGHLPVYVEVEGKKRTPSRGLRQVATMTVINGRSTLDCKLVERDSSSGAALHIDVFKAKVERDGPFNPMEGLDLEEEPPRGDDAPPSPNDAVPDGADISGPGAIVPYDGGPGDGGGDIVGDLG